MGTWTIAVFLQLVPSLPFLESNFTSLMAKEIFTPSSRNINIFALHCGEGRNWSLKPSSTFFFNSLVQLSFKVIVAGIFSFSSLRQYTPLERRAEETW